jgi:hypothetical protein
MKYLAVFVASVLLACAAGPGAVALAQSESNSAGTPPSIALPAGTKIELAVTAPVVARTAKPGDPLYTQTVFPVTAGTTLAIPAGTYVQGQLLAISKPTRKNNRAEIQVLFTKIIFADGYTLVLPVGSNSTVGALSSAASIAVQDTTSNDLLLDNGAQLEMTLAAPLSLDATEIAQSLPLSRPVDPGKFKSATLCRPTPGSPGTPGTSDTIIPGSPGTPSTTIPGGPGMPDIVIPGTPATPDTVIPGMPGTPDTPGTSCPAPPMVQSSTPLAIPPAQAQSAPSPLQ